MIPCCHGGPIMMVAHSWGLHSWVSGAAAVAVTGQLRNAMRTACQKLLTSQSAFTHWRLVILFLKQATLQVLHSWSPATASALNKGLAKQNKSLLNLTIAGSWTKGFYRSDADTAS